MCTNCKGGYIYENGRRLYTNFVTALCLKNFDILKGELTKK